LTDRVEAYRQVRTRHPDISALLKKRGFPVAGSRAARSSKFAALCAAVARPDAGSLTGEYATASTTTCRGDRRWRL